MLQSKHETSSFSPFFLYSSLLEMQSRIRSRISNGILADSADCLSSTSCRLWLHFDFFRDSWKCGSLKRSKVYPNILESPERWIHSSNCQDYFAKGLIPKCNRFCPVGRFSMSPLNQTDSLWNVLCGLWTEHLNTVGHTVRVLQGCTVCCTPIKINEAQLLQNKDHQQVPGEPFPIRLGLQYSTPGCRADNRTPPHR